MNSKKYPDWREIIEEKNKTKKISKGSYKYLIKNFKRLIEGKITKEIMDSCLETIIDIEEKKVVLNKINDDIYGFRKKIGKIGLIVGGIGLSYATYLYTKEESIYHILIVSSLSMISGIPGIYRTYKEKYCDQI